MPSQDIAAALKRVETVLLRRPEAGLHEDASATARWQGGTRIVASHANGTQMETDMPSELGGSGDRVTPGWMFRAGVASCAATSIALQAAAEGIELDWLEVRVGSHSDTRGMLGMADADGTRVCAAPVDVHLDVRIAANGVSAERLRHLVEHGYRCSPMPSALRKEMPVELHIEVESPVAAG